MDLPRDISISNLNVKCYANASGHMHGPGDGQIIGILNDYDLLFVLSSNRDSITSETPNKQRTGTAAFMACDLLDLSMGPGDSVTHKYRRDVESFMYVLIWIAVGYKGFKCTTKPEPLKDWKGDWKRICKEKEFFLRHFLGILDILDLVAENYNKLRSPIIAFHKVFEDAVREAAAAEGEKYLQMLQELESDTGKCKNFEIPNLHNFKVQVHKEFTDKMDSIITWNTVSSVFAKLAKTTRK